MKIKIMIVGAVLIVSYLLFSSPEKVVVDVHGDVIGVSNKSRELLQGKSFWNEQLQEIDKELAELITRPERMAKFIENIRKITQKHNQSMEEFYKKNPEIRPSAAQVKADALKREADRVEDEEIMKDVEKFRIKRIAELQKIKILVKEKVLP